MDFLDLIIVLFLLIAVYTGFKRGFSWIGPSIAGLVIGMLIGSLAAPAISNAVAPSPQSANSSRPLIAMGVFLFIVFVTQGIGTYFGFRLRIRALVSPFARWDSFAGSLLAVLGTLVAVWYAGLAFKDSFVLALDRQIQDSRIVRTLDSFAPELPGPLVAIQHVLSPSGFPPVLAGLGDDGPPAAIPATLDNPAVRTVSNQTVKVTVRDSVCHDTSFGTGWPISSTYIVTNAHVVAGGFAGSMTVAPQGKPELDAEVVAFDPTNDIAVLHVPKAHFTALSFASDDPQALTVGIGFGYPNGGDETPIPAQVRITELVDSFDIYGSPVTRTLEILAAHVIPGDSGGPLVDGNGHVIGVIFAASTSDDSEGYALALSQVRDEILAAVGRQDPVGTGDRCSL